MTSRYLLLLLPSMLLSMTGCVSGDTTGDRPDKVHNVFLTTPVTAGAENGMTIPATVEESSSVSVGFKTAGQISRIMVKEGDAVREGQLLAVLDTVDYALGVNQLRLQYATMEKESERHSILHQSRNMSDNDFEKSIMGLQQLKMQLELQENKLAYCRLYSPVNGVVTKRNNEPSELVDAGNPVFEIMDNGAMQVVVNLPARLYNKRHGFTSFTGESPLFPGEKFPLTLLSITPRADNHQLYKMKLSVPRGSCPDLTAGMGVTVTITAETGDGDTGVEIPTGALFSRDGETCVWVFNPADSTVHATPVVPGSTGENGTVTVTGGISTGDAIVRAGVHHLKEGEKVCPIKNQGTDSRHVL